MRSIFGISANCHDSADALLRDGEFVAAAQEERFTRERKKFWLAPLIIVMTLIVVAQGSLVAPFIFTSC